MIKKILAGISRFFLDHCYDWKNNILTRGVVFSEEGNKSSGNGSYNYQSVHVLVMRDILRNVASRDMFVDIGCGHGRACFMAAKSGKFSRVLGMDFNPKLLARAEKNKASFRYAASSAPITFEQADALTWLLPAGVHSCVFLSNPFGPDILLPFLQNNMTLLCQNNSCLVYNNPIHLEHVLNLGFRIVHRSELFQYVVLMPSGATAEFL